MANLTLYYSQWIIVDNKFPDMWYGLTLALSTLLLILTATFLGRYSDKTQKRMQIITPLTIVIGIATIPLGYLVQAHYRFLPKSY